jgi:hypothetical protein
VRGGIGRPQTIDKEDAISNLTAGAVSVVATHATTTPLLPTKSLLGLGVLARFRGPAGATAADEKRDRAEPVSAGAHDQRIALMADRGQEVACGTQRHRHRLPV